MDKEIANITDKTLAGEKLNRDDLCILYEVDAHSPEAFLLHWAAQKLSYEASNGVGNIYAQLGFDASPCIGNCKFCSFAKDSTEQSWDSERALSLDEIIRVCKSLSESGVHLISLMSTASFPFDNFIKIVSEVRTNIRDDILLMSNIGDFNFEQAQELKAVGLDAAYHAIRMREGEINDIPIEKRRQTLAAASAAGLHLMSGVEPLFEELSASEVADRMLEVSDMKLFCTDACTLKNVRGARMGGFTPLSFPRLKVLSSILKLLVGTKVSFNSLNTRWFDAGTNPRGNQLFNSHDIVEASINELRKNLEYYEWAVP
jgi:biotin synthase